MKKYEIYLDVAKWDYRDKCLDEFQSWLHSLDIQVNFDPNSHTVSKNLSIYTKHGTNDFHTNNTSVKIQQIGEKYWIVVKYQTEDPILRDSFSLDIKNKIKF